MKKGVLKKILDGVLNLVYPEHVVCIFCNLETLVDDMGVCRSCAQKLIPVESCEYTLRSIPQLDGLKASFRYSGTVAEAVKRYKYNGHSYLGKQFAQFMEIDKAWKIDCIVPVPLHPAREKERGYNQCLLLAKPIAERYGLELDEHMLKRTVNTDKQSRKNAKERVNNLTGAFEADRERCAGKSILLVDDVCTTGNTLRECATELKEKGALSVYALVMCYSRKS